jgi:hypothetical protein
MAQEKGLLPKSCTVIMFDRHHDALDPPRCALSDLKHLRATPIPQGIAALCAEHLKKNDDDWLKSGMELGLFGDAVIFGAERFGMEDRIYPDQSGDRHRIVMLHLPRAALSDHGSLCDVFQREDFGTLWEILGWSVSARMAQFSPGLPKVFLTIDFDCFAIE